MKKSNIPKKDTSGAESKAILPENKVGRPTKYDPEFCEKLIDHMALGLSFESFAAVIDVNRDSLYEWEKSHPEFSDAVKRAKDKCLLYWEKLGRDHVLNETLEEEDETEGTFRKSSKSLNPAVWIFNMKNRFRDHWNEKQLIEHSGGLTNVSDEDLEKRIAALGSKQAVESGDE